MKILELFSGTESFSKVARERGHECFTVDNDPQFNPDLCIDVMDLKVSDIPFRPDVIWASPPCTEFSIASVSTHWKDRMPPEDTELVIKTLEIIMMLKPKYWFIENPRGMMRKLSIMDSLNKNTITYCQYGDTRMKPTDIWNNLKWGSRPMCKNGMPCHEAAPRGSKTGTQGLKGSERSVVPPALCLEIIKACEVL